MIKRIRRKAIELEAVQFTGNNLNEVRSFMKGAERSAKLVNRKIRIHTLEGSIYADELDWIIKGVDGEFYPCKPDILPKIYDILE